MVLPYDILSSSLDIAPHQSIYTNTAPGSQTDTRHPAHCDTSSTVLPVWCRSGFQSVGSVRRKLDSFHTDEVTKIILGLKTDCDWILHTSWFRYLKTEFMLEEMRTLAHLNVKKNTVQRTFPFTEVAGTSWEDREEEMFYYSTETYQKGKNYLLIYWFFFVIGRLFSHFPEQQTSSLFVSLSDCARYN